MPAMELSHETASLNDPLSNGDEDAILLRRYVDLGNAEAMEALFQRHAAVAYQIALRSLGNVADAEDAVQTAFCVVLQRAGQFKQESSTRGWIMGIVLNTCRTKFRDENCRRKHEQSSTAIRSNKRTPELDRSEIVSAAFARLNALPERYRLPVFLRYIAGFSYDDVASALSLSEETARRQTSRGIEQIRQALAAAGFTASMAAIPDLLASSSLPTAPTTLTTSIKTIIASAAKGAGVATWAASATVKGTVAATASKVVITIALLFAVVAAIATAFHFSKGKESTQDESRPPVASASQTPPEGQAGTLAEILDKKIDVVYRRDYLSEVLDDLDKRVGLHSAFPKPIDKTFMFSLEQNEITVKHVLEKLAADGKLELEYHGDEVVFWKRADDQVLADLEKKLKDNVVEARCEAAFDLAQLGDKRIYALLALALSDPDDVVAMKAYYEIQEGHSGTICYSGKETGEALLKLVESKRQWKTIQVGLISLLGQSRNPKVIAPLTVLTTDPDWRVRSCAACGLALSRDPRAMDPLIPLLKDADVNVRTTAAGGLGMTHDPRALELLLPLLKDSDETIRHAGAWGLFCAHDPRSADALISQLKDSSLQVRKTAVEALGHLRTQRALDALIPEVQDADAGYRKSVVMALAQTRNAGAIQPLIALLKDNDAEVRQAASAALSDTRDPRAAEALIRCLSDNDAKVRADAAIKLREMRDPRALAPLMELLRDNDQIVRGNAAIALGYSRDSKLLGLLLNLLKDKGNSPYMVIDAIGSLREPLAVDALFMLAKDPNPDVDFPGTMQSAACALCKIQDQYAVEALLKLLSNDGPACIRNRALCNLSQLRDPRTVEWLIPLLKDTDRQIRISAVFSLAQTRDPRGVQPLIAYMNTSLEGDAQQPYFNFSGLVSDIRNIHDLRAEQALAEYEKKINAPASASNGDF
jgi:RNA polymerase sigma factor (sigma-70 family)